MRGLFVTGTGTGVGKTVLSAALLAAMSAAGVRVRAHKPVVTGLNEPSETGWPPDHELLASVAGMTPAEVAPLRYEPAVSPHLAAALAGETIDPAQSIARARAAAIDNGTLIVEGVGGLLVPLANGFTVRDLAVALGLPLVIAAGAGLGTINYTLLSIESARAAGLDVRAVVLTPWPQAPTQLERSNCETIARLGEVEVAGLGRIPSPTAAELARAGSALPWQHWCPESFIPSGS
ncbi:MAG TPA: dethiobiotin synthase [Solirubrobacteraceae bacterium]|jgi:dethiobiotin synthetase